MEEAGAIITWKIGAIVEIETVEKIKVEKAEGVIEEKEKNVKRKIGIVTVEISWKKVGINIWKIKKRKSTHEKRKRVRREKKRTTSKIEGIGR